MTTFIPLSNYVLIEPQELPDTTPSGILLPEGSKERPNLGIVFVKGAGQRNEHGELIPMTVQIGNKVFFQKYSGIEVKLDGKKYLLMRETDILGILNDD